MSWVNEFVWMVWSREGKGKEEIRGLLAEHLGRERRKRIASWKENQRREWKLRKGTFQVKGSGNRGRCSPEVSV